MSTIELIVCTAIYLSWFLLNKDTQSAFVTLNHQIRAPLNSSAFTFSQCTAVENLSVQWTWQHVCYLLSVDPNFSMKCLLNHQSVMPLKSTLWLYLSLYTKGTVIFVERCSGISSCYPAFRSLYTAYMKATHMCILLVCELVQMNMNMTPTLSTYTMTSSLTAQHLNHRHHFFNSLW